MNGFARIIPALERLLLTAWVGVLWGVGYLAVPVLFAALEDRVVAGRLAGEMFHLVSWVGLVCGGLLLARVMGQQGQQAWRSWALATMLGLTVVNEFILQPRMAELKGLGLTPGSEVAASFATLHGVSSSFYLVISLLGALLVAAGLRAAAASASLPAGR